MKDNKHSKDQKRQMPQQEHNKPQQPMSNPAEKAPNFPQNWPKKKGQ
jgi:hypothetical protein